MIRKAMVAALVVGSVLAGTGVADAEASRIPKNFLLSEKEARAPRDEADSIEYWWKISDKLSNRPLLAPCRGARTVRDGRVAMRTITHLTSAPSLDGEQLVLYRSAKAARAAFLGLRAEVKRCPGKDLRLIARTVRIGDEGMFVGRYDYYKGKRDREPVSSWAVGRRGAALFVYSADQAYTTNPGKLVTGRAKRMAKKVCELRNVCR
ncbi:hypothetical protein [Nonomuraea sp. NPDC023979]|uniref:hypothetical protein n=1 Tax=Nonomuraea sp. NPDC023979 TaxID=3154796 RepID=UPI00340A3B90